MLLSEPELEREPARAMQRRGFQRAGGLRNVEGHLTKPFLNDFRGEAEPGEPLPPPWLSTPCAGRGRRAQAKPPIDACRA